MALGAAPSSRICWLLALLPLLAGCAPSPVAEPKARTQSKILDGTDSDSSQDSVVSLRFPSGGCSGTLIAPNLVLTALHCVAAIDTTTNDVGDDFDPHSITVSLGADHSVFEGSGDAVGAQVFHDDTTTLAQHDVAVILLDRELDAPTAAIRWDPLDTGATVTAVGYGVDESGQPTSEREQVDSSVVGIGPTFGDLVGAVPDDELVTDGGICHGDSGGPLLDELGQVAGVASRVSAPEANCVDAQGEQAIYGVVAAHRDLIQQAAEAAGHPLTN